MSEVPVLSHSFVRRTKFDFDAQFDARAGLHFWLSGTTQIVSNDVGGRQWTLCKLER